MRGARVLVLTACLWAFANPAIAVEGPTVAGPIGGTDMRSAVLPPPGLYGGTFGLGAQAYDFVDAHGDTIPALRTAKLHKEILGPFLDGELRCKSGVIQGDVNGDGRADFEIQVNVSVLKSGDFIL